MGGGGWGAVSRKKVQTPKRYLCLGTFSRRQIDNSFLIFLWKTGFDISCKLSPLEKIYMKYQILFPREKKKNRFFFSKCCPLKFLLRALSVYVSEYIH